MKMDTVSIGRRSQTHIWPAGHLLVLLGKEKFQEKKKKKKKSVKRRLKGWKKNQIAI